MNDVSHSLPPRKTHELLGLFFRNGHAFGAVFSFSDSGYCEHYTPVDFIGTTPKFHTTETAESGLLMPISHDAADKLKQVIEATKKNRGSQRYYYKSFWNDYDPKFERKGCNPLDYDGTEIPVDEAAKQSFTRGADAPPLIATNCIHFLLNACSRDAHIPLHDLHPALKNTYDATILPQIVNEFAFYGESLHAPVECKSIPVMGDSRIITIQSNSERIFSIPNDLNVIFDEKGNNAVLELLHSPPLDHQTSPTSEISQARECQHKLCERKAVAPGMSAWL